MKMEVKKFFGVIFLPFMWFLAAFAYWMVYEKWFFQGLFLVSVGIAIVMLSEKKNLLKNEDVVVKLAILSSLVVSCYAEVIFYIETGKILTGLNRCVAVYMMLYVSLYFFTYKYKGFIMGTRIISWMIWVSACYSIIEFYYFGILQHNMAYRVFSCYRNPIPAGTIFLIGLWLPLTDKKNNVLKRIKFVNIIAIFFTQSRSVWLGTVFSIFVYVYINKKKVLKKIMSIRKTQKIIICIAIAIIVIAAFPILLEQITVRMGASGAESFGVRSTYLRYVLKRIISSDALWIVFGRGFYMSRIDIANSPVYWAPYNIFDDDFLTILYEWGLLGIIAIGMLIKRAFSMIIVEKGDENHSDRFYYAMVVIACIFPSFFYELHYMIVPAFLVIMCLSTLMKN